MLLSCITKVQSLVTRLKRNTDAHIASGNLPTSQRREDFISNFKISSLQLILQRGFSCGSPYSSSFGAFAPVMVVVLLVGGVELSAISGQVEVVEGLGSDAQDFGEESVGGR